MAPYSVEISEDAQEDLRFYRVYERRIILDGALAHLGNTPDQETPDRKRLRPNPIAPWELRIANYRVFYVIEVDEAIVTIVSVGHKAHNRLYIRGKAVQL